MLPLKRLSGSFFGAAAFARVSARESVRWASTPPPYLRVLAYVRETRCSHTAIGRSVANHSIRDALPPGGPQVMGCSWEYALGGPLPTGTLDRDRKARGADEFFSESSVSALRSIR